jgi:hypothetical protein
LIERRAKAAEERLLLLNALQSPMSATARQAPPLLRNLSPRIMIQRRRSPDDQSTPSLNLAGPQAGT